MTTRQQQRTRRTPLTRLRTLPITLLVASSVIGLVAVASPAQAAAGNILPPFAVGETWKIYQGYGPDAYSHHNGVGNPPSLYGLDLTHGGTDTSSYGKTVKAPIGGTATYSSGGGGTLCINTPNNGPSVALTHISVSVPNGAVSAGDTVGTVLAASSVNGYVAHIHLQRWTTNGCWGTGNGGVPFDSAHNARICGAPDLTATGGGGTNGVWSGTNITGSTCDSTPLQNLLPSSSVISFSGKLYVFGRGIDSQIYQDVWDGNSWSGFTKLQDGAVFSGNPQAVQFGTWMSVFARGTNGEIYNNAWNGTSWSGFQSLQNGAVFTGDPVVVQFNSGLHVFAKGIDGGIYKNTWNGTSWSGFANIQNGAVFGGKPSVIVFGSALGVFARGSDGQIYNNSWDGSSWTGFQNLQNGAVFEGDPVAVQSGSWLGIFARGINGEIYNNAWSGSSWTGFTSIQSGATFNGNPAVVQSGSSLGIFARGTDDLIYNATWNGSSWTGFVSLQAGAFFAGDPLVAQFGSALGVFARGINDQMYNNTWEGSSWSGFQNLQNGAVFEGP